MRKPVTSDRLVLEKWPKSKKGITSAAVAAALGITVFQITARLKGMEKRGLVSRTDAGLWSPTGKEAPPEVTRTPSGRVFGQGGGAVGLPDDSKVPHVLVALISPSEGVIEDAKRREPVIKQRIGELEKDRKRHRVDLMKLYTERDSIAEILKRASAGKTWRTRLLREEKVVKFKNPDSKTGKGEWLHMVASQIKARVYIAPDGVEYTEATPFETADLIAERKGGQKQRLRRYETSSIAKKETKKQKELDARQQAKEEKRGKDRLRRDGEQEVLRSGIRAPTEDEQRERDEKAVRDSISPKERRQIQKDRAKDAERNRRAEASKGQSKDAGKGGKGKPPAGRAEGKTRALHGKRGPVRYSEFL